MTTQLHPQTHINTKYMKYLTLLILLFVAQFALVQTKMLTIETKDAYKYIGEMVIVH